MFLSRVKKCDCRLDAARPTLAQRLETIFSDLRNVRQDLGEDKAHRNFISGDGCAPRPPGGIFRLFQENHSTKPTVSHISLEVSLTITL